MHKKLFLLILTGQSMLAMEPVKEKDAIAHSQEEKDMLGRELIEAIVSKSQNGTGDDISEVQNLIAQGANVNYIHYRGMPGIFCYPYNIAPLMHVAVAGYLTAHQKLILAQELLKAGADVNLINSDGETALMNINPGSGEDFAKHLIQGGLDIYYENKRYQFYALSVLAITGFAESSELILQIATQLTDAEKASIKSWLLSERRLRNEGNHIFKDLRRLIAECVIDLYVADVHERVIRTGAPKALGFAHEYANDGAIESALLENYLNLDFLKRRVRSQLTK